MFLWQTAGEDTYKKLLGNWLQPPRYFVRFALFKGDVADRAEEWGVPLDVIDFLQRIIPRGVWRHDAQDGNGDAHLKSGLVGPSESIPLIDGELGLSTWQNVFFCEFDSPRRERRVVCTIVPADPSFGLPADNLA
jgi:hypothetical protein